MSDTVRAYVAVAGGVIAILIALLSSLAVGPGPLFTFDKVVVGALLVGGLGAVGVSINIGQSPEARAAREYRKALPAMPRPASDFDKIAGRIRAAEKEVGIPLITSDPKPIAETKPVAEKDLSY